MKALIKVGYACNENCTFCHTAEMREQNDTAPRVEWKIERAKKLGYSMVVLSGGEPTIRPELLRWARLAASIGLDFGLVTNGLLLSYPHVTDELVGECRLRYVYMSIHGGDAKVHRSVVRAETFQQTLGALQMLAGKIPDLTANCVVTTANMRHLRALVDRLLPLGGDICLKFSMTQPKGAANKAADVIIPDVEECARYVLDAIDYGQAKRGRVRFAHDGIPFCLLPGLEALYDDLKTHRFASMIEVDEDDFVPVDDVAKVQPEEACGSCSLRGACPGLYKGYFEARGAGALRPVLGKPRANSYNFVPERDIARAPGAPCPLRQGSVSPFDRGRTLFLRLKDRIRLFRTETRDFSDAELLAIKEDIGQIYLDLSTKLAPDDFSKDILPLRRSSECDDCEKGASCAGTWEPVRVDVFTRDDARVLEVLSGLRGRVLDLGCGEGPYLRALAERAQRGEVEYIGVDPDEGRLRVLASRYPFARFVAARAEDLGEDIGPIDHALVLRSYNHLEDPREALRRVVALLKPGGTLTLADNVAFGLVRSRALAARAEGSSRNRFEHFRNDGAEAAARALTGLEARLLERRDVARGTSNQWLLRYERVESSEL